MARGGINNKLKYLTLTGKGVGIHLPDSTFIDNRAGRSKLISMGDHVTFSTGIILLVHDAMGFLTDRRVAYGRIIIEDYVSISARVLILPGTRIGRGSIVGAGAVVTGGTDIPPGEVWAGVPAKKICTIEEYMERRKKRKYMPTNFRSLPFYGLAPLEIGITPEK